MPLSGEKDCANVPNSVTWPDLTKVATGRIVPRGKERFDIPFRQRLDRLLAGTRGGWNRCRMLKLLQQDGPMNANQIASALALHYTTVQHHLERLVRDDVVAANPRHDAYGALFYLTYQMERNAGVLEEILRGLPTSDPTYDRGAAMAADRRSAFP